MKVNNIITVLSGILFILSGIVILMNIKVPIVVDFTKLLGIAFIAAGIGVLLGASFTSSLTFAISVIILLLSLSTNTIFINNKNVSKFNITYKECNLFKAKVQMSELNVMLGKGPSEAFGTSVGREIGECYLYLCCGKGKLILNSTKELFISNVLGNVYINAHKCLKMLSIENYMGNVRVTYEVPKGCSGALTISENMGNTKVYLIVPKGVKVEYGISSNFGSYEVLLPNGIGRSEGAYGIGQNVVRVRASINMGSFKLVIGEKR